MTSTFPSLRRLLILFLALMGGLAAAAPVLSTVTPGNGPTAGGTRITLTGSNFGTSGVTVSIGGKNAPIASLTNTQITADLPVGQGTNQSVVVTNSVTGASNSKPFNYDAPTISSLIASNVSTAGGSVITLTGTNFGLSPTVSFGSSAVSVSFSSHTQIVGTVAAGQGGSKQVTVLVGGQTSNAVLSSYSNPAITSITPSSIPTGGGTSLTIIGTNFGNIPAQTSLTIGGASATITSLTHTSIIATSPAGQGASLPVTLTVSGLSSPTTQLSYLAPNITGISPSSVPTSGGSLITLTGTNFGLTPSATFGSTSVQPISSTHTSAVFVAPPGQGLNQPVQLTVGQQTSNTVLYNYDAPSISSITPTSLPTSGNTSITIIGSNFGTSGTVNFGSSSATVSSYSHNQIIATPPAGQGTNLSVSVTSAARTSNAMTVSYQAPAINSIIAGTVSTAGGSVITLSGSNFGTAPTVLIGGNVATINSRTHTTAIVEVPAGQGTNKAVQILVGSQSASSSISYSPPSITGLSYTSAPTSGGVVITVNGSNFGNLLASTSATLNGVSITPSSVGHALVAFTLPAGSGKDLPLTLAVSGQVSSTTLFSYDAPSISSLSLARAPTAGNVPITINGSSFGLSGSVKVGQSTATVSSYSHSQIIATIPPGEGANPGITITTGTQTSSAYPFGYNAPVILSLSAASGPVAGNVPITINGSDFGLTPTVLVGSGTATVSAAASNHSRIVCTLPPGTGRDKPVIVNVGDQASNSVLFSYLPHDYDTWLQSLDFNGLSTSPTADPLSSGWPNLLSYALGVDPLTVNGGEFAQRSPARYGKPSIRRNAMGQLEVGFWKRNASQGSDLQYQVQFASGLEASDWQTSSATPQIESVDGVWDYCTVTDTAAPGAIRFGRLKVVKSTP